MKLKIIFLGLNLLMDLEIYNVNFYIILIKRYNKCQNLNVNIVEWVWQD